VRTKRRGRLLSSCAGGAQPQPFADPSNDCKALSHSDKVWKSNKRRSQHDEEDSV
jgi:hypothetical protein